MFRISIVHTEGGKVVRTKEWVRETWIQAKKSFYNAVYNNPDAKVTLFNASGATIRIGSSGKTEYSSNENPN